MQDRLEDFLKKEIHIKKTDRILCAVSGGADSVVMLRLLCELGYEIEVAHVNYGLRGDESKGDENFVRSLCDTLNIPCHVRSFDTNKEALIRKTGIQETARDLRYAWFEAMRKGKNCQFTATAHNQSDNLETVLIHQIRGTGLRGYAGIHAKRSQLIRPLLIFTSVEIRAYAEESGIEFREDSSNMTDTYLRNKIRHSVIPKMLDISEDLEDRVYKNTRNAQAWLEIQDFLLNEWAEQRVNRTDSGDLEIPISSIQTFPQPHLILYYILSNYGFSVDQCHDICTAQTGSVFTSKSHVLSANREYWSMRESKPLNDTVVEISEPISFSFNQYQLVFSLINIEEVKFSDDKKIAFFDANSISFPVLIRRWHEGDEMQPLGMRGNKLLSDIMTDAKIDIHLKREIPIVCKDEEILWLAGVRQSELGKIVGRTQKVLKVILKSAF